MNDLGTILCGTFVIALVLLEIFHSPKIIAKLKQKIKDGDLSARTNFYKKTAISSWAATAVAIALMLIGGLSLTAIGFAAIDDEAMDYMGSVLIGALVGIGVISVILWRQRNDDQQPVVVGDIEFLLPRTRSERRWWAVVAVTAGITEEIYFRALPILFFDSLIADTLFWPVVLSSVVFGLGHMYQGIKGVIGTGLLGLLLGSIYAFTGSLIPGMVLHVLIDLRVLTIKLPEPSTSQPE